MSSHQPRDLTGIIRDMGCEHIVVRMYLDMEQPSADHSRAQVDSARANGCSIGCYLWLYRNGGPEASAEEAIALARSCGVEPPVMWIDVETYGPQHTVPTEDEVLRCIAACRGQGVQPGVYTGRWVMDGYYGGTHAFADAGAWLWSAQYDWGPASEPPLGIPLYCGWTEAHGHQWTSNPVDRNTFLSSAV